MLSLHAFLFGVDWKPTRERDWDIRDGCQEYKKGKKGEKSWRMTKETYRRG